MKAGIARQHWKDVLFLKLLLAAPVCPPDSLSSSARPIPCVPLLARSQFVVNIMSEWFVEAANHCCGNFDYGEDEMALSGLTPLPSVKVGLGGLQCACTHCRPGALETSGMLPCCCAGQPAAREGVCGADGVRAAAQL